MVINGSCSTNMYARQLSFNFLIHGLEGAMAPWPPLWIRPWLSRTLNTRDVGDSFDSSSAMTCGVA